VKDILYMMLIVSLGTLVLCVGAGFMARILWGFAHVGWVVGGLVAP
jgi:hypothetical protein